MLKESLYELSLITAVDGIEYAFFGPPSFVRPAELCGDGMQKAAVSTAHAIIACSFNNADGCIGRQSSGAPRNGLEFGSHSFTPFLISLSQPGSNPQSTETRCVTGISCGERSDGRLSV